MAEYKNDKYDIRLLHNKDMKNLHEFFEAQDEKQFEYFHPHKFDIKTLNRLYNNASFPMFGVFEGKKNVGYFFLRCFINKKCFIGRFINIEHQGKGLGKVIGKMLYSIAWNSKFRVFSTISINNSASFNSHKSNKKLIVRKKLGNNFYLIEFISDYQENKK